MNKFIITPRFNDCDQMGHINNSIYLSYAEEARIHFLNVLFEANWDWKKNGIIVRKHEIEYLKPITYPSEITIETKIGTIGNKSFELIHVFIVDHHIVTNIKSILIYFDYHNLESKKLDETILKKLYHV